MISDEIELEDSSIQKFDKEIDEYLCHRRNFELSLKFGDSSGVSCVPYKASWLVTIYHNDIEYKQEQLNYFPEAFKKFQEFCTEELGEVNQNLRTEY